MGEGRVGMGRTIGAFVAATLVTLVAASFVHSSFVIAGLTALGIEVPPALRIETMGGDLIGLAPALGPIIAAALLLGFAVAGLARRVVPLARPAAFALAGAAAFGTAIWLMNLAYGMTPLASARSWAGVLSLCAAAAIGGLVFASVSRARAAR